MVRKPCTSTTDRESGHILDLIHTDVCGPMQTTTPGGKRYVMTMIDDHSKHTEVYLLKYKSEATDKMKEYVKYVKIRFGKTPKKIRSDGSGEYVNEQLRSFLRDEGITVETSLPHSPQQNGSAGRKNRYLTEMTRSMLIGASLPKT